MDPLSALAVAGNVLQFLQFTATLFSNTWKIHQAALGFHENGVNGQDVEGIHTRLLSFSSLLNGTPGNDETAVGGSVHSAALGALLQECRGCCDRLLAITQKLQVKDDTKAKWWKSFEKAVYEIWKKEDIDHLKSRIRYCQTEMVLQLCAISRFVLYT